MWRRLPLYSLVRRIIVSVALCLTLILALYLFVALWTIDESIEAVFRDRVTLATVLAGRVDEVLSHAILSLQAEAVGMTISPGEALTPNQRRQLEHLDALLGDFSRIAVVDTDGRIIWTAPGDDLDADSISIDVQSIQHVVATGQPLVAEVAPGVSASADLIVPLLDPRGQPSGALVAELHPADSDLAVLPTRGIGEGLVAQLMNADGRLIAGAGIQSQRGAREHALVMADLIRTQAPGYRVHDAGAGGQFASHVVAYAPVTLLPSWGVAVEQPIDLVLAMPRQLERRLAITGAASFALIIALAWLDVRRVVRPLKRLTEAAERIADGQLDEPFVVDRGDELGVLARAFETMRLQLRASLAKVQDVAILEERGRIAREMHDGLGQVLGYVNTKALAVARLLDVGKVDEARAQVTQLEAAVKDVYADVREAVLGLRTTLDPERDFLSALRDYAHGFEQQSGIQVAVEAASWPATSPLPLAAEVQLVRIVQEALANVRKHAGASHAIVRLAAEHDTVRLSVQDNGHGFDPARLDRDGWPRFGLQTMRERAEGIGGAFALDSRPGAGTHVRIAIPAHGEGASTVREVVHAANARPPGRRSRTGP